MSILLQNNPIFFDVLLVCTNIYISVILKNKIEMGEEDGGGWREGGI